MKFNKNTIIVLGGSFNPPTIAHKLVLEHALSQTGAGIGLFVPSSEAYVARKARKHNSPLLFSEQERLDMLNIMIKNNTNLQISTCEYGDDGRGHTYRTMCRIQKENPDKTCCFLTGADNLRVITRWHSAKQFLDEFPFVIMSRDKNNANDIINQNQLLREHKDTLIVIHDLPSVETISSSQFQKLYSENDKRAKNLVNEEVYEFIKRTHSI